MHTHLLILLHIVDAQILFLLGFYILRFSCSVVCLYDGLLDTLISPAKTAETMYALFGGVESGGPRKPRISVSGIHASYSFAVCLADERVAFEIHNYNAAFRAGIRSRIVYSHCKLYTTLQYASCRCSFAAVFIAWVKLSDRLLKPSKFIHKTELYVTNASQNA